MKKIIAILIFTLSYILILGNTNDSSLEIDTCSPNFKEVYDFQIGDVFQYVEQSSTSAGGIYPTTRNTLKYRITNKISNDDTLIYTVTGIKKVDFWCEGGPVPDPFCDPTSISYLIDDTLIYIDSADLFLNSCENELITGFMDPDLYTRILLQTENSNQVKIVGGFNNLFTYNEEDSLIAVQEINYEKQYAKGLGEIKKEILIFEFNESGSLQGYIKNGDTTGIITKDEDLKISAINSIAWENILIYPNPTNGIIFINNQVIQSGDLKIELFDINGSKLMNPDLSDDGIIDLTAFNKGMYFLKIIIDDNIFTKKVLLK